MPAASTTPVTRTFESLCPYAPAAIGRAHARQDSDVDERLAQRAQNACEKLAEDRDLEDVDFAEAQARGRDTVEIDLRARVRGDQQSLTCLYDDDQRHAVLAE